MIRAPRSLLGAVVGIAVLAGAGAGAQAPKGPSPQYLPFAEFVGGDTSAQVSVKQGYNDAVERYNKALYDYHVTLGQHDQLVDAYNKGGTSPADQEKARAEAVTLRAKLESLRRDVTALAGTVDQARRKASQAGVTLAR